MNLQEARFYLNLAVSEGYMSEDEGVRIASLPDEEMIKTCEELGERGDAEL